MNAPERTPSPLRHEEGITRTYIDRGRGVAVEGDLPPPGLHENRLRTVVAVTEHPIVCSRTHPGQAKRVWLVHSGHLAAVLCLSITDRQGDVGSATRQARTQQCVAAVHTVAGLDHTLSYLLDGVIGQSVDVTLLHGFDESNILGHKITRNRVDQPVVRRQMQPERLGLFEHGGAPDDPAGHITPEHRVQDAVIRAFVGETAEDPGWHGDDVTICAHILTLFSINTPAQSELTAKIDEHFSGEMQVQIVRDTVGHSRRTGVESVILGEIDNLSGVLRHTRTDESVVLLLV